MLCALIMAGGKGERFWPLSTENKPKQFLNLLGNETMLQMTVNRLKGLIPIERIFVVTAKAYEGLVKEQLLQLPYENIIIEPVGKNTAPSIILSAFYIKSVYKDAVIAVFPSDHQITEEEKFRNILKESYHFILNNKEAIVTIGVKPTRAETGYGYIRYNKMNEDKKIIKVESFIEKPNLKRAELFLEAGNYLWNAGMYIWNVNTVLTLAKRYLYDTYNLLSGLDFKSYENFKQSCNEIYMKVNSISVDFGIMEKAKNVFVIIGDFGWDDVGSWNSVERYSEKSEGNNVFKGKGMSIDGDNNLIVSKDKPIVILGMDNMLVVESSDIIFIAHKDSLDKIKEVKNKVINNV